MSGTVFSLLVPGPRQNTIIIFEGIFCPFGPGTVGSEKLQLCVTLGGKWLKTGEQCVLGNWLQCEEGGDRCGHASPSSQHYTALLPHSNYRAAKAPWLSVKFKSIRATNSAH